MCTDGIRFLEQGVHLLGGLAVRLCGLALGGVGVAEWRHEHRDAFALDTSDCSLAPVAAVCNDRPDRLADARTANRSREACATIGGSWRESFGSCVKAAATITCSGLAMTWAL
jgi:hypothetical protein